MIIYGWRVEPVENVLRDVDWKTLIFLAAIFCMVQGFIKTGLLQGMSLKLHGWFGTEFTLVAMILLGGIGVLSAFLANLPVVAASLIMTKGYLVVAEVVGERDGGHQQVGQPVLAGGLEVGPHPFGELDRPVDLAVRREDRRAHDQVAPHRLRGIGVGEQRLDPGAGPFRS